MKKIKFGLPMQLIALFIFLILGGEYLPLVAKENLLAISLIIKDLLQYLLPFIIFGCLFSTIIDQKDKALSFIIGLFALVSVSNLMSTLAGYFMGRTGLNLLGTYINISPIKIDNVLQPAWHWCFKNKLTNGVALSAALSCGLFFSIFPDKRAENLAYKLNKYVTFFLKRVFVPVLPLFALGFIVKMQHEGTLALAFKTYLPVMLLLLTANLIYLGGFFLIAAKLKFKTALLYFKNSIPAALIGFTTLSSLAAMQTTMECSEKNNQDGLSKAIIPATVNNHMIGSSIGIPILALFIFKTQGLPAPSVVQYFIFAQYFVLAKFTVAAVPCGSVIVMIPLLEHHLGFSSHMSGLITTMYLLFNPISAAANVLGNTAFSALISRFFKGKLSKRINKHTSMEAH